MQERSFAIFVAGGLVLAAAAATTAYRAVPGHEFGLKLAPDERAELIAFLRTL